MKQLLVLFTLLFTVPAFAQSASFSVNLDDDLWDGFNVPEGQQCQKFGGINPATPALILSNIPSNANIIVMEYSDRTYKPMDNGGHGKIAYTLSANTKNTVIPSVAGHSFNLPKPFYMVNAHLSPKWDKAGAYMPPCSGGRGNTYYVTVKAVAKNGDNKTVIAQLIVELGNY